MLYKRMQYFVSIVKHDSFTEAAEENFISQSAISQQMHALEEDLGVQLFVRKNRAFELTEAGKYLYHQSLSMLNDVDMVKKEIVRIAGGSDKILRIGYLRSLGSKEIGNAVALFTDRHQDMDVELEKGNHEELFERMKNGTLDLVINDQRRAFSDAYVNFELVTLQLYVELNKKNYLSGLEFLSPEDVRKFPCILISSKEQQTEEQEFYGEVLGIGTHYIFSESIEEARLLVSGNRGYFLTEKLEREDISNRQIVELPMYREGNPIERKLCVFWKKSKDKVLYQEFADILKSQYKEKQTLERGGDNG